MEKAGLLRFFTAVILITLTLLLAILPQPVYEIVSAFQPVLVVVLLMSLLCGWFYGLLSALLLPFLLSFIRTGNIELAAFAVDMVVYGVSAIMAGITYRVFASSLIACLLSLIAGRAVLAIYRIIVSYIGGISYTLGDFFEEGVMNVLPGLILALLLPPLIMAVLNKTGVSEHLRNAPQESYF